LGGAGYDLLAGGAGNDIPTGGEENDTFVFPPLFKSNPGWQPSNHGYKSMRPRLKAAYAARWRSTYCRMPPFLKYSSSSARASSSAAAAE